MIFMWGAMLEWGAKMGWTRWGAMLGCCRLVFWFVKLVGLSVIISSFASHAPIRALVYLKIKLYQVFLLLCKNWSMFLYSPVNI